MSFCVTPHQQSCVPLLVLQAFAQQSPPPCELTCDIFCTQHVNSTSHLTSAPRALPPPIPSHPVLLLSWHQRLGERERQSCPKCQGSWIVMSDRQRVQHTKHKKGDFNSTSGPCSEDEIFFFPICPIFFPTLLLPVFQFLMFSFFCNLF